MQILELNKDHPGTTVMEIIIKGRFPGRLLTEIIAAGAGEYEPSPDGSDEGKFYIEEDTKDVYEVVNGKKVKVDSNGRLL